MGGRLLETSEYATEKKGWILLRWSKVAAKNNVSEKNYEKFMVLDLLLSNGLKV